LEEARLALPIGLPEPGAWMRCWAAGIPRAWEALPLGAVFHQLDLLVLTVSRQAQNGSLFRTVVRVSAESAGFRPDPTRLKPLARLARRDRAFFTGNLLLLLLLVMVLSSPTQIPAPGWGPWPTS